MEKAMTNREKINTITQKMAELLGDGPMLPGNISEQWNVCGKKGCRCRDKVAPRRHGPYSQLSFTLGGKGSSMFIKSADLRKAQQCTLRHREFKRLLTELLETHIRVVREHGFENEPMEDLEK